jgi:hypothetical protein
MVQQRKKCSLNFHFLTEEIVKEELLAYANKSLATYRDFKFHFYEIPRDVEQYTGFQIGFRSKVAMLKVMPDTFLPERVRELVIIDFDTLVLVDICDALNDFDSRFKKTTLYAGVPEHGNWYNVNNPDMGLRIPSDSPHKVKDYLGINSGVLFVRVDRLRQFNWRQKWHSAISKKMTNVGNDNFLSLGDQNVFNYMGNVFDDIVAILPNYWNRQNTEIKDDNLSGKQYIAHGNGYLFRQDCL